jgi:hypothetical protein
VILAVATRRSLSYASLPLPANIAVFPGEAAGTPPPGRGPRTDITIPDGDGPSERDARLLCEAGGGLLEAGDITVNAEGWVPVGAYNLHHSMDVGRLFGAAEGEDAAQAAWAALATAIVSPTDEVMGTVEAWLGQGGFRGKTVALQLRLGRTPGEGEALFPDRDFIKDFVMCGYAGMQEDARGGDDGVQWVLVGDTNQAKDNALQVLPSLNPKH